MQTTYRFFKWSFHPYFNLLHRKALSTVVKKDSFESLFEELESVVEQLEQGDVHLEEALKLFERGIVLCRKGTERLDAAERTVQQLIQPEYQAPYLIDEVNEPASEQTHVESLEQDGSN